MISLIISVFAFGATQEVGPQDARPSLECAAHVRNDRARRNCLNALMETAEDELDAAMRAAVTEAEEIDLETGGILGAADAYEAAHAAWQTYRDRECERRAALMLLDAGSREELATDCRISLTRARRDELGAH